MRLTIIYLGSIKFVKGGQLDSEFVYEVVDSPLRFVIFRKMTLANLLAYLLREGPVKMRIFGDAELVGFHPVCSTFMHDRVAADQAVNRVNLAAATNAPATGPTAASATPITDSNVIQIN